MEDSVRTRNSRSGWWIVAVAILGVILVAAELWQNVEDQLRSVDKPVEVVVPSPTVRPSPGPTPTSGLDHPYWGE
ncbi:MAG: hypothetical protein GY906_03630 [bacterium]|nr:hypothetical protein [bacterium]